VAFPVGAQEDVYVSVAVRGSVASASIDGFPGSVSFPGRGALLAVPPPGAEPQLRARAVAQVEVEGAPTKVFFVLGDSITEGYLVGDGDYRHAWPFRAQLGLGAPVLNGGVSGQDTWEELLNFREELGSVKAVTDCVVALGMNDLPCGAPEQVTGSLQTLVQSLRPSCRVWLATITPRERTTAGPIERVNACRVAINAWVRGQGGLAGVLDFDAVTRNPAAPEKLQEAFSGDGVHPNAAGQAAMGAAALQVLSK
jgi:lysophospholipase L1-like esterase